MNQILFNNEKSFLANYEIVEDGPKISNKKIKNVIKKQVNTNYETREPYISVHISLHPNMTQQSFQRLRQFKYLSIIQPIAYYEESDEQILVYKDYSNYKLNGEKLKKLTEEGHIYRIILQLALFYAELDQRKYYWYLKNLEDLYYVNGLIKISLGDYDFDNQPVNEAFEEFNKFFGNHFPNQYQELESQLQEREFQVLIDYLCQKEIGMNYEKNYEKVLQYLLQIDIFFNIQNISESNTIVKSFATPLCLSEFHPELDKEIVYKSRDSNQEQSQETITTEITMMEENESASIAVGSLYFRINKVPFILMKKYNGTKDLLKDNVEVTVQRKNQEDSKNVNISLVLEFQY